LSRDTQHSPFLSDLFFIELLISLPFYSQVIHIVGTITIWTLCNEEIKFTHFNVFLSMPFTAISSFYRFSITLLIMILAKSPYMID